MSLVVDLTPEETKRFEAAGIDVTRLLKGIAAGLPQQSQTAEPRSNEQVDPESISAIAYLQAKVQRAITDPDEILKAENELEALQQRLNENRLAAGEMPLFAK